MPSPDTITQPLRMPTPPVTTAPQSHELSPVSVFPQSHSISSLLPSTSSQYNNADALSPPPLRHQPLASPTPNYTPKVSFDTFENPVANMFSFTLQVKSEGYRRTRHTRVFLCASSPDESGSEALEWSLESLVQEGDELIVFRGVDEDVLDKDHDIVREEARELMRMIQEKSFESDPERKLSLILEYIPGKVTSTIDRLIALYRPDSLVVGTRGNRRFGFVSGLGFSRVQQGLGVGSASIGSVSKYCLSHSPVPVIVVRPGRKLKKAVEKRRADPKRGTHFGEGV